jgi:hypothetical protein
VLPSFEIENFRTFSSLRIDHLGGVNLIVGHNNVGKTMLLEALRLYASKGNPFTILDLLYDRDELMPGRPTEDDRANAHLRIGSLFNRQSLAFGGTASATLRTKSDDSSSVRIEVHAVRRVDTELTSGQDVVTYEPVGPDSEQDDPRIVPAIVVTAGEAGPRTTPLDDLEGYARRRWRIMPPSLGPAFVAARGVDPKTLARQWDAIALREAEDRVSDCLRIVAPIGRITAVEHPGRTAERMFLVRIENEPEPVSLKSLGDGMVRIFQIALALESAKNGKRQLFPLQEKSLVSELRSAISPGILLIDEVENGIHFSVLRNLWQFVFKAAGLHSIQVFATTHSWDCVKAFQEAAAEEKETEGVLIRLEKRDDRNKAVTFSEDELAIVTRERIEVR